MESLHLSGPKFLSELGTWDSKKEGIIWNKCGAQVLALGAQPMWPVTDLSHQIQGLERSWFHQGKSLKADRG